MQFKFLTKIALGLLAGTTFSILLSPETTLAQNLTTDPSQDYQKQGDAINGGTGQTFDPLNLIHNSNLRPSQSLEEFNQEQKQNLDEAATQFRAIQRQRLQLPDRLIDRLNPNTPTENTTTQ
ncbi:hypothetical protein ACE1CI_18530 [Aerosakkonemataceae cyanobacterium BLCC-F50]|uniref:Uncharacterized protein n=1 Tax=Floridaenema flaviceps BLCC-F50 TaxID=3153642 RepID=A0ABV4XT64_9CYAN